MLPPALQDYRKLGVVGREDIAAAAVLVSMAQREGEEQPELLAWLGFCWRFAVYVTVIHVDFDNIQEWAGGIDIGATNALDWLEPMHGSMHYRQLVHLSGLEAVDALSSLMDICSICQSPFGRAGYCRSINARFVSPCAGSSGWARHRKNNKNST